MWQEMCVNDEQLMNNLMKWCSYKNNGFEYFTQYKHDTFRELEQDDTEYIL